MARNNSSGICEFIMGTFRDCIIFQPTKVVSWPWSCRVENSVLLESLFYDFIILLTQIIVKRNEITIKTINKFALISAN